MIKLFRNNRRKFLSENKFSKYLAYAIGEIFLVVVGILIAIWINSKNQEKINEKKAEVILMEIQKDLKKDIESSTAVVNTFINYDSIARLLLWDKLTTNEMFGISNKMKPYEIVYKMLTFKISDNGYVNYNRNLNNIPTKYNSITNKLKYLYDTRGVELNVANERVRSIVFENIDKVNTFDWSVQTIKTGFPEEGKHYYAKNLEFKKQLITYMNGIGNVFLTTEIYKLEAITLHNEISKILNTDDYISYPPSFNSSPNASNEKHILGKYKLKETVSEIFPSTIELREVKNKLQFFREGLPEFRYYWNGKTTFLNMIDQQGLVLTYIRFNKSKNSEFFVSGGKSAYAYYTKVSD